MPQCSHKTLTLLQERKDRLRCKKCHLIISADELSSGCCPECYAVHGERRYDFEEIETKGDQPIEYRCDQCGALVEWKGDD
jgi:Zn finger protein HypA/HybF involved in hydrogenase expression